MSRALAIPWPGWLGALRRRWQYEALSRCTVVGAHPHLKGRAHFENLGRIEIGDDLILHSEPVVTHLVTGPRGLLRIGNGVEIGHGCSISAHAEIHLGDGVAIGPFAMILDSDFHQAGDHAKTGIAQAIHIARRARLGPWVTVLRGARIGEAARILAGSVVAGEIPAGALAGGVPAQVLTASGEARVEGHEAAVAELVRRTLGLAESPAPHAGPADLPGWDSLGTLNLLLALEQAFAITLDHEAVLRVQTVGDLASLVERTRAGGGATPSPRSQAVG